MLGIKTPLEETNLPKRSWVRHVKTAVVLLLGVMSFLIVVYLNPFQPIESAKQVYRHFNVQSLINPEFEGVDKVNAAITQLMDDAYHFSSIQHLLTEEQRITMESQAVDRWVSENIRYESDLKVWGFTNHYPTPNEVLEKGMDDCDGMAILTTSILLSRGIAARMAMNGNHAWAEVVKLPTENVQPTTLAVSLSVPAENPIRSSESMVVYDGFSKPANRKPLNPTIEKLLNFLQSLPFDRVFLWALLFSLCFSRIMDKESILAGLPKAIAVAGTCATFILWAYMLEPFLLKGEPLSLAEKLFPLLIMLPYVLWASLTILKRFDKPKISV